jgi:hypothetical protein
MTEDQEDELIGSFTQETWLAWVKAGWLEGIQEEFGPLKSPREEAIFETAWKLGLSYALTTGRLMAAQLQERAKGAEDN